MRQLYRPRTEGQLKIMGWLLARGVTRADVAGVELLGPDRVRLQNPAGQYMVVEHRDGRVWIDQTPDTKEEAYEQDTV